MDFNTSVVILTYTFALIALAFYAGYKTGWSACLDVEEDEDGE